MVEQLYQTCRDASELPNWLAAPDIPSSFDFEAKPARLEPQLVNGVANAIFHAARQGQPEAIALVRRHAAHFGVGVANIVNAFNPQRIIIWGDSLAGGELFLEAVREVVKQRALARPREMCEIVFSSFVHDTGLVGASSLAIHALFNGL